ncbi:MAG TPA: helix-turn-helix domain-containing protein [Polyangiaceae bacterium]|nr:helix-turn-helix domain-containing protein [Polyangiaceae bacterium]
MLSHIHAVEERSGAHQAIVTCRRRRRFTTEEKQRITLAAKACKSRGELSDLLRSEGITHSHLATWRERYELNGLAGLAMKRPGPRPTDDERDQLIHRQRRAILELERELSIVKGLVEMQKKAHEILGISRPRIENTKG